MKGGTLFSSKRKARPMNNSDRLLLTMFFVSCFVFHSEAQLLTFGPKVGMSFSALNASGDPPYSTSGVKPGFNVGFFFIKEFSSGLYLQLEPTYSAGLGGTLTYQSASEKIRNVTTVSLPLFMGKRISNYRFFVGLAPGKGLATSEVEEFLAAHDVFSEADEGGNFFIDYTAGAGLDVRNLMFNVRYSNALVSGFFYDGYSDNFIRVSQIVISVGVKLNKN